MSTKDTVTAYFERLGRKEHWEDSFADDIAFTSFTSPNKQLKGKDVYLERTSGFYSMIRAVEIRELVTEGDRACVLSRYTLQRPGGAEPFTSDVAEFLTVRDDLISSLGICFDTAPYSG
jgi:hypothetical protein